jgi:hypothetical protein
MKKIILSTKEADNVDADRKNFKYFFNKPLIVKEKETMSLSSITAELRAGADPVYDSGLLTVSGLSIDETTIPTSIYNTSWFYNRFFLVDLDDTNVATVYNSSGGSSNGSGATIRFVVFQDYGTGGFPRTTKIAYVENSGEGYEAGDYIIVNQNAFPTGYLAQNVNMRIDINSVKTKRITSQFPTGIITGISLDPSYTGEISQTNQNFTHSPVSNGQGTEFVWGTTTNAIINVAINDGGYGWEVGDIIWVPKYDVMADTSPSRFLVPLKVEITSVTSIPLPPPTDPNKFYTIKVSNILNETNNIISSDYTAEALVYNFDFTLYNEKIKKKYNICNLHPQIIQGININITPSNTNLGLLDISDLILNLKISS